MKILPRASVLDVVPLTALVGLLLVLPFVANAQKRRPAISPVRPPIRKSREKFNSLSAKYRLPVPAIVIAEKLAVLRFEPSLTAIPLQRMRAGRNVLIVGEKEADGVTFFRVTIPPDLSGWVQSEAIASGARPGDDERVAKMIRFADGFDQLELASIFLENFPKSAFRSAILLLAGDLAEEAAQKISRDALRKLDADEMEASGAPVHSFYLNFNELDRYRRIGVNFTFNQIVKEFHYDGAAWREIAEKHAESAEAPEARKRLGSLATQTK